MSKNELKAITKKKAQADSEPVGAANWRKGQDVVPQPESDDDASN